MRGDGPWIASQEQMTPGSPAHRARRAWRVAFVVAAIAATLATHWPDLTVGVPDEPIDKLLHASTFAALTLLLWQTRWIQSRLACAGLMLAWAAVDEISQSIPIFSRRMDALDFFADAIGVLLSGAFLVAVAPAGHGLALLLASRRRRASDWLFARPMSWLHFAVVGVLGVLVGGPLGVFIDSLLIRKGPQPWEFGLVGGLFASAIALHLLLELGTRHALRRCASEHACLACGTPSIAEQSELRPCATCGVARRAFDWAPTAGISGSEEIKLCLAPILQGTLLLLVVSAGSLALVTTLRLEVQPLLMIDNLYRTFPSDLRLLIDIASIAAISAWTLRRCRRRIAARIDTGGERCLACGFDLRATSPTATAGCCHECGAPFLRVGAR